MVRLTRRRTIGFISDSVIGRRRHIVHEFAEDPAKFAGRRGDLAPLLGLAAGRKRLDLNDLDLLAAIEADLNHVADVAEAASHAADDAVAADGRQMAGRRLQQAAEPN